MRVRRKCVRMTATTPSGTTYSATVATDATRETLEALDAMADAVRKMWEEGHLPTEREPPA